MKKSFVVFGLGRFGSSVAVNLYNQGADVMAIDKSEALINEISDSVTTAIQADVCDRSAVAALGLDNFDGAVISMSESLESSIMAIIAAKNAGIPEIWVKSRDEAQGEIFTTLGATRVFIPEKEHAASIARSLYSGMLLDFVELSDKVEMVKIPTPAEWVGKSLIELSLRKRYGINVIAVVKDGKVLTDIAPDEKMSSDTFMFIVGDRAKTKKLLKQI